MNSVFIKIYYKHISISRARILRIYIEKYFYITKFVTDSGRVVSVETNRFNGTLIYLNCECLTPTHRLNVSLFKTFVRKKKF